MESFDFDADVQLMKNQNVIWFVLYIHECITDVILSCVDQTCLTMSIYYSCIYMVGYHFHWLHMLVSTLRWRRNGHRGVSNRQPHRCLLNLLFGCRSKKISKLRVTGLCAANSPGTGVKWSTCHKLKILNAIFNENIYILNQNFIEICIWKSKLVTTQHWWTETEMSFLQNVVKFHQNDDIYQSLVQHTKHWQWWNGSHVIVRWCAPTWT